MKHTAQVLAPTPANAYPIYALEQTTPTGIYHWARSRNHKPPLLREITRVKFKTLVVYRDDDKRQFGYEYTIWKRGWHHIKGVRKLTWRKKNKPTEADAD